MYLIERRDPDGVWRIIDRSKYVRLAAAEFVATTGLPIYSRDVASDVRHGNVLEGVSVRTDLPVRIRDARTRVADVDRGVTS